MLLHTQVRELQDAKQIELSLQDLDMRVRKERSEDHSVAQPIDGANEVTGKYTSVTKTSLARRGCGVSLPPLTVSSFTGSCKSHHNFEEGRFYRQFVFLGAKAKSVPSYGCSINQYSTNLSEASPAMTAQISFPLSGYTAIPATHA